MLNKWAVTLGVLEVEDGIVISEEVDLIHCEGLCSHLLDDALHDFIVSALHEIVVTVALLTTLTFLLCDPLPPVRASPTLFLNFSMLA